jgi:hypothetical protein
MGRRRTGIQTHAARLKDDEISPSPNDSLRSFVQCERRIVGKLSDISN